MLSILAATAVASTADVFVAVNGSDANTGTDASAPLKSLEHAQSVARALSSNSRVAVTVHLGAGDFFLDRESGGKPLVLDAADSGVSWVGSGAATTAIRGGLRVTGWCVRRRRPTHHHTPVHLPSIHLSILPSFHLSFHPP